MCEGWLVYGIEELLLFCLNVSLLIFEEGSDLFVGLFWVMFDNW